MPASKKKSASKKKGPIKKTGVSKKKSAAKKAVASKKATKKKAVTQKATKKAATSKKATKKKTVTQKATKKATPSKKATKKKTVTQKATKKATPSKKATKKKTVTQKTTNKKTVAQNKVKTSVPSTKKKPAKQTRSSKKANKKNINYDDLEINQNANTVAGPLEFTPYHQSSEDYMSEKQLSHFETILENWREQLMSDVDTTVGHLQKEGIAYADPLDRAAQEEGFNLELRTRDRERKLLKKIEQALDWISEGSYGYCEDCGAEIGIRRLEARPTAAKCIDCKTFSEIREKQIGR